MSATHGTVGCEVPGAVRRGEVRAVFDRSSHLCADGVFITLGDLTLPAHPYSVRWPGFTALRVGQEVTITHDGLRTEGRVYADFSAMEVFTPTRKSQVVAQPHWIAGALAASRAEAARIPSRGGFHDILLRKPAGAASALDGQFTATARARCSALARTLALRDREGLTRAALDLAGMGIGLTPAGDDFLAGVLSALRYYSQSAGEAVLPQTCLDELARLAGERTSPFSAFLLASAAKGLIAQPLADWLDAVHRGLAEAAVQRVPEIAALGHSSGLDTLAGMLLALETVLGEPPWTR